MQRTPMSLKTPTRKKYIVCPGHVISKADGTRHYISASKLMELYDVAPHECIVIENWPEDFVGRRRAYEDLIILSPRDDGNYHFDQLHKSLQGEK
ncbi:MAG: hypothetical protein JRI45_06750 [Deltaproteobacteria bacterium]|nr:hypothetical protein [Deltaproteobacteria bacterium]